MNKYKFKITYRNEDKYGHYLEDNRHNVSIIAETLEQAKEKLDKIEKNCDYPCKNILNWDAEEIIQENQQQELERYKNIVNELEKYIEKHFVGTIATNILDKLKELKGSDK